MRQLLNVMLLVSILTLVACAGVPNEIVVKESVPRASHTDAPSILRHGMPVEGFHFTSIWTWQSKHFAPYGSNSNQCRFLYDTYKRSEWQTVICFDRWDLDASLDVEGGAFGYVFSDPYRKVHFYQWWDLHRRYYLHRPWRGYPRWEYITPIAGYVQM